MEGTVGNVQWNNSPLYYSLKNANIYIKEEKDER